MSGQNTNGGRATGAPSHSLVEGQPFIPHKRFNGIWLPMGIFQHPLLSHGAKLLYGRLCLFAGKSGECYASLETLAKEMLCSVDTVSRFLQEMEKAGLIKRERRGHRQTATCKFIWRECLRESLKAESDSANLRSQEAVPIPQPCGSDSANLRSSDSANLRSALKEEKIQYEKIHRKDSSSFEENASVAGSAPIEAEPIDDDEPVSQILGGELLEPGESVKTGAAWASNPEAFESVREALRLHKYSESQGERPDYTITRKVMAHFTGEDDFLVWLENLAGRMPGYKVKSYAFYPRDAEDWPSRRPDVLEAKIQHEREAQAAEAEAKKRQRDYADYERIRDLCRGKGWKQVFASDCTTCAGYGRNPVSEQFCSCGAGRELQRCKECNNQGTIDVWPTVAEMKTKPVLDKWCTCQHAERVKAEKGADFVDRKNAEAWAQFRHQQQSDRWDELYRTNKAVLPRIAGFREMEKHFALSGDEAERETMIVQLTQGIARCSSIEATFCRRAA